MLDGNQSSPALHSGQQTTPTRVNNTEVLAGALNFDNFDILEDELRRSQRPSGITSLTHFNARQQQRLTPSLGGRATAANPSAQLR
jgi:hypothetical protein